MLVAVGLLGGCQAQDQRITRLDYMPGKPAAKLTGPAVGVAMPAEAHGPARNNQGEPIVGDIVKSNGSVSGHVVMVDSIPRWVGSAVAGELRAAGVNASLGLDPKPGRAIVKTEIVQIKNETKSQWSSNAVNSAITLSFKVEKDGVAVGSVEATGAGTVEAAAKITDVMQEAMQMALHDAMKKGIPDVANLIRKSVQGG
jgi:hypothetical protein